MGCFVTLKKVHIECLLGMSNIKDTHTILQLTKDYCEHGREVSECPAHLKPVWIMFKHYLEQVNKGAM